MSEFEFDGFPNTRESYQIFAKKFDIPTSTEKQSKQSTLNFQNKNLFLNSIPALQEMQHIPQITEVTKLISALETLE